MALAAMIPQSPDTDPTSERLQIRALRAMPVWQRIAQFEALNAMADAFAMIGLRRVHPTATPADLRRLLRDTRLQMLRASEARPETRTSPDRDP
jgi:hypothetical protein